jgi:hypothetical protein
MARIVALALLLLLSACAPAVLEADVTRFHGLPGPAAGTTFAIQPDQDQAGSLEFQHYAADIAIRLAQLGWRPQGAGAEPAQVLVSLHWGLGPPHTVVWGDPPDWGWGPGPWYPHGPYGYPRSSPYMYQSETLWPKWLEVEIVDGPAWRKGARQVVWQGRAIADTRGPAIAEAMPALVAAVFADFPGISGQVVHVRVPLEVPDSSER